ncbi:MAG: potassium-transporting ATPase subunit C [Thermoplasmata archaeon]
MTLPRVDPPQRMRSHVRAAVVIVVLSVVVVGLGYPALLVGIADIIAPGTAGGSLLHAANGTVVGSSLVGQNFSRPYLFWDRPSMNDYNTTLAYETPPGPTNPALLALLNETISYMKEYGNFTVNASLPLELVSPSYSGVDPYLTPESVLVQVPRVANATNESVASMTAFVNSYITQPLFGFIGPAYVNVVNLDYALVAWTGVGP